MNFNFTIDSDINFSNLNADQRGKLDFIKSNEILSFNAFGNAGNSDVMAINIPELEIPKSQFEKVTMDKLSLLGITLVYDANLPEIVIQANSAKFKKLKW